jgi:hypothetical protein
MAGTQPDAPPLPSERVRDQWRRRTIAEYRSAAITQHLSLWIIQLGLSADLVRDGLRIIDDELVHAELSRQVLVAAGDDRPVTLDRASLALPERTDESLEQRVLLAITRVFCLGETVAVPLFRHLRADCTVPVARAALDRILVDEGRHRAFGWDVLEVLVDLLGEEQCAAVVAPRLGAMLADLDTSYGAGAIARDTGATTEQDRAWGVVPPREYAPILEATVDAVWVPRFARLGIEVEPAGRSES